jgi:hypothetical protein
VIAPFQQSVSASSISSLLLLSLLLAKSTADIHRIPTATMKIINGLVFAGFLSRIADSFPSGAGSCAAGTDAILLPGQSHANNTQVGTTFLADFGINVKLNSEVLEPDTPTDFSTGVNHTLTIVANNAPFLGFLARVEGSGDDVFLDTTSALASNSTDVQVALSTCINVNRVGGVTHTSNDEKMSVSAILMMDEPVMDLLLDITVVVRNINSQDVSEWYFSRYMLNAIGPPMSSPTKMPTGPPVNTNSPSMKTTSAGLIRRAVMGMTVAYLGAAIYMV